MTEDQHMKQALDEILARRQELLELCSKDAARAETEIEALLLKAHSEEDSASLAICFECRATLQFQKGMHEAAEQDLITSLVHARACGSIEFLADNLGRQAFLFIKQDMLVAALEVLSEFFSLDPAQLSPGIRCFALHKMAQYHERQLEADQAEAYNWQILEIAEQENNPFLKAMAHHALANVNLKQDRLDKSTEHYKQAESLFRQEGDTFRERQCKAGVILNLHRADRDREALEMAKGMPGLSELDKPGFQDLYLQASLGLSHTRLGDADTGEAMIREAIDYTLAKGLPRQEQDLRIRFAEHARLQGDLPTAIGHQRRILEICKELHKVEVARSTARRQIRMERVGLVETANQLSITNAALEAGQELLKHPTLAGSDISSPGSFQLANPATRISINGGSWHDLSVWLSQAMNNQITHSICDSCTADILDDDTAAEVEPAAVPSSIEFCRMILAQEERFKRETRSHENLQHSFDRLESILKVVERESPSCTIEVLGWMGVLKLSMNEVQVAEDLLREARALLSTETGLDWRLDILHYLSQACIRGNKPEEARFFLTEALQVEDSSSEEASLAKLYHAMATVHRRLRDEDESFRYSRLALKHAIEEGNLEGEALACNNMGARLLKLGEYGKAREYFLQSKAAFSSQQTWWGNADVCVNLAFCTLRLGLEDESRDWCRQAMELIPDDNRDRPSHLRLRVCMAEQLFRAEKTDEALEKVEEVISSSVRLNFLLIERSAQELRLRILEKLADRQAEYDCLNRLFELEMMCYTRERTAVIQYSRENRGYLELEETRQQLFDSQAKLLQMQHKISEQQKGFSALDTGKLVPLCAWCGAIRTKEQEWESISAYLKDKGWQQVAANHENKAFGPDNGSDTGKDLNT